MIRFALLLIAAFAVTSARAQPDTIDADTYREGKRITVLVEGEGPDVVLIPGLSTPRDVWRDTRTALSGRYRLHLVQIRGFGDAAGDNATGPVLDPVVREIADYIDDAIIDAAGRDKKAPPPAIIGHSLGGLAALMIAQREPQLAGRVLVVDALPFIGPIFGVDSVATIEPRAAQMRDMLVAQGAKAAATATDQATDSAAPDCDALPADAPAPPAVGPLATMSNSARGACYVAQWTAASDLRVVGQAMYDDMVTDLRPDLGAIATPITVLYARDPRMGPAERVDALWAGGYKCSKAKLVAVDGSFHFIMLDQPRAFAAEVERFLAP